MSVEGYFTGYTEDAEHKSISAMDAAGTGVRALVESAQESPVSPGEAQLCASKLWIRKRRGWPLVNG